MKHDLPLYPTLILALALAAGCGQAPRAAETQAPPSGAEPEPPFPQLTADHVQAAQAAFIGEVVDLSYRTFEVDLGGGQRGRYPHTFVTARVETPLKGGEAGEEVTLRFLGGLSEDGARRLVISDLPVFELGDRAVFLVRDNGAGPCPLVGCRETLVRLEGAPPASVRSLSRRVQVLQRVLGQPELRGIAALSVHRHEPLEARLPLPAPRAKEIRR